MTVRDISIEFAHLYADQQFLSEQQYSLMLAARHQKTCEQRGLSVSMLVMIDDLHASSLFMDRNRLRHHVLRYGGTVDDIILESSLIPAALELIATVPSSLVWCEAFRRERKTVLFMETPQGTTPLLTTRKGRHMPSCAVLSATLLLTRLGALGPVAGITPSRQALTIIEERFRHVEACAHSIIEKTRFADCLERIETIHFNAPEEQQLFAA